MSGGLIGLVIRRTHVTSTGATALFPRSKKALDEASGPPRYRSTSDHVRDGASPHDSIVGNVNPRGERISRNESNVDQAISEPAKPPGQKHAVIPPINPAISAKHLIRSLLRECTYIPDAHARQWVKEHILQRHRRLYSVRYSSRDPKSPVHAGAPIPNTRNEAEAFKQGLRGLHQLQRANAGSLKMMLKVLGTAYGRIGRRRHELLAALLKPEGEDKVFGPPKHDPDDTKTEPPDSRNAVERLLTPQLQALAHSQVQTSIPNSFRKTLRNLSPSIPTTNAWQQPMPQKRVRNLEKEWYATLLDRVHAPLPVEDWKRLSLLVSRPYREEIAQPPRRSRAGSITAIGTDSTKRDCPSALEAVVMRGKVPLPALGPDKSNQLGSINSRSMRRLWRRVFAVCPLMIWNDVKERWGVTWGAQKMRVLHQDGEEK